MPLYPPASAATGGGNSATAVVDFGSPTSNEGDVATTTVAASWALSTSSIVCSFSGLASADHDPDDPVVEGLVAYAANIVDGVGFNVVAIAPQNTWGRYNVNIVGV